MNVILKQHSIDMSEICMIIGVYHTNLLIMRFSGMRIYIPCTKYINEKHDICIAIGKEKAIELCKQINGNFVYFPVSWSRIEAIKSMIDLGLSNNDIALKLGISERTVRRHRKLYLPHKDCK